MATREEVLEIWPEPNWILSEGLRHPFTGVGLAQECGVPDALYPIITTHTGEGNLLKPTAEALGVHHTDFMTYEPLVKGLVFED
ncbi:MAG: hypothetical protein ACI8X5_001508 [Planctomycetota bacterium]|jgi:hypothetical protein